MSPRLAVFEGGDGRGHAKHVHIAGHARADALEVAAQFGIGDDGKGAGESGDVPGFARRHQGDGAGAGVVAQVGKGAVAAAV